MSQVQRGLAHRTSAPCLRAAGAELLYMVDSSVEATCLCTALQMQRWAQGEAWRCMDTPSMQ